jgi:hypothetical protein
MKLPPRRTILIAVCLTSSALPGELHVLNYSLGTVVKIIMPPAPPTGVRFVRPGGDTQ